MGLGLTLTLLVLGVAYGSLRARLAADASYWRVQAPYPLESERFGVGGSARLIGEALWEALGAGWYGPWDTDADPTHPSGARMLQPIWTSGDTSVVDEAEVKATIQANPGSVWRVGNEPDSTWQGNATPQQYARVYHQLCHLIKSLDTSAQVAFGGLVQATPLRLLYLEQVRDAYLDTYGAPMPVDVWTLHSFILPETPFGWGAGIPPGMNDYVHLGQIYGMRDHDDVQIFSRRIRDFRQWMADHGQRDKPLLIPEYGCLLWSDLVDEDGQDFGDERVIAFMTATFDFFLSASDLQTGYPADGDRLVQAWTWYSLTDDVYVDGQKVGEGYGGDLFSGPDPETRTPTPLGKAYAAYVAPLRGPAYSDLFLLRFEADLSGAVWGEIQTLTLNAEVANHGRQPAQLVSVAFWDGEPGAGGARIGAPQVVPQVPGRYEGAASATVTWTTPISGAHTLWVEIDEADAVAESDESNNTASLALDLSANLTPVSLIFDPPAPFWQGALLGQGSIDVNASAMIANTGAVAIPGGVEVALHVKTGGGWELAKDRTLGPLAAGGTAPLTATLTFTSPGLYPVRVTVDRAALIAESDEADNTLTAPLLVAAQRQFLPLLTRH